MEEANFIMPPSVALNPEAQEVFLKAVEENKKVYQELVKLGIPQEDARYMMAQGVATIWFCRRMLENSCTFLNCACVIELSGRLGSSSANVRISKRFSTVLYEWAGPLAWREMSRGRKQQCENPGKEEKIR
jgi:hypothetical protein